MDNRAFFWDTKNFPTLKGIKMASSNVPNSKNPVRDRTLKSNQMTEIGAFMVRTKLASEFEFPAPILQGRTAGTENKFKNFCLFTTLWTNFEDIGPLCKKRKLRVQACDWSKNSAWCVNFENEFFLTNHIVALSAYNLSFFICWIETNSSLVGLLFPNIRE